MHIAYTAIQDDQSRPAQNVATENDQLTIKLQAYYTACDKYSKEITAIQKYLPGWVPPTPAL